MKQFKVSPADAGTRLDIYVANQYPQFTRSSLEMLFDKQLIHYNAEPAKPSQKIRERDVIQVDDQLLLAEPETIDLPVIYEDDNVVVINKPDGVLSHSNGALNTEATVASFIRDKLNDPALTGNRAGIVHRLDRQTSGVIITARNSAAQKWLQKQFSNRRVKKTYIAIAEGHIDPERAIIDAPIARNPKRPQTFMVSASGRPAQTEYETQEEMVFDGKLYTKLMLKPATGRTHQLRVHLAYISHPIVGDKLYGHDGPELLLHAYKLEITLPNHQRQVFEAPLPAKIGRFNG
jgi:23S rRNA pseudouridine1911/1915/1917 synthase